MGLLMGWTGRSPAVLSNLSDSVIHSVPAPRPEAEEQLLALYPPDRPPAVPSLSPGAASRGMWRGIFFSPDPSSPVPSVGHRETIVRPRRVTLNAEVILPLRANPELLPSR